MNNTLNINETKIEVRSPGNDKILLEALALIDNKLTQLPARNIVSAGEMSDLLLDLRLLLTEVRDIDPPTDKEAVLSN